MSTRANAWVATIEPALAVLFVPFLFCLCISCFSFVLIGYCYVTSMWLHEATLTSGSASHHLGCTWHAGSQKTGSGLSSHLQTWVTLHHLINPIKLRVRAKPPLCEHDISCILGLRRELCENHRVPSFNLYIFTLFILLSEINVTISCNSTTTT